MQVLLCSLARWERKLVEINHCTTDRYPPLSQHDQCRQDYTEKDSATKIKFCLNTNRNEGLNRALSASLPKNVNFSRNVKGRACAAIDRLNYGAGDSLLRKLETSEAPISKGGRVAKAVRQMNLTQHTISYTDLRVLCEDG